MHAIPKLFTMVEVEINSRCNLRCSYCPVSIQAPTHVPALMAPEAFERLLSELARLGFGGRISYHFYNEPLLHPNLIGIVQRVASRLPLARQVLYTNGELLDDDRYDRLRESGIVHFVVTSHRGRAVPERAGQTVLAPRDLVLTNRGGALPVQAATLPLPCFAPSTMLIVTVTGDVVLCYEDYYRSQIFGNIMQQPLDDIWASPRFVELRRRLAQGDRSGTEICRSCNNGVHQAPETFDYVL